MANTGLQLISETRLMWDMPITVAIVGAPATLAAAPNREAEAIDRIFDYFKYVDETFSTFKPDSEISRINRGELSLDEASPDMRLVFALAEEFRTETGGYFDIVRHGAAEGKFDPLGLVKGWALNNAAEMLADAGYENFYVEAGGDFQAAGLNAEGRPWRVGIRSPFKMDEIVKVLAISDAGVATSGTYIRGQHIYNPVTGGNPPTGGPAGPEILSITVIGPDVCDADCYATAAFAMGGKGIAFIEGLPDFEGYMIDRNGLATFTSGFERYVDHETH